MARWQLEDAVRIRGFYVHFPTSNICIQVTNIRWLIHCHFKFIHYGCVCKNWGPRSSNTLRKIDISQGVVGILIGDRQAALVFRPLIFWGNIFLKILKEWLAADGMIGGSIVVRRFHKYEFNNMDIQIYVVQVQFMLKARQKMFLVDPVEFQRICWFHVSYGQRSYVESFPPHTLPQISDKHFRSLCFVVFSKQIWMGKRFNKVSMQFFLIFSNQTCLKYCHVWGSQSILTRFVGQNKVCVHHSQRFPGWLVWSSSFCCELL